MLHLNQIRHFKLFQQLSPYVQALTIRRSFLLAYYNKNWK